MIKDSSSDKENIPPEITDKDEMFDFDNSSFKYDNEYSSDESYVYSSQDDTNEYESDSTVDFAAQFKSNNNDSDGSRSIYIGECQ